MIGKDYVLRGIVGDMKAKMVGRLADEEDNTFHMLRYVFKAGRGNHLEIGSLFGGSAICVALMKDYYKQSGMVYAVDPLDGYYFKRFETRIDDPTKLEVNFENFQKNVEIFGVEKRIIIVPMGSHPFPKIIEEMMFTTAYIDGDHWGEAPLNDWNNVKDRVSDYVIFDNDDEKHEDVMATVEVANKDPDWEIVYREGITCVLERLS